MNSAEFERLAMGRIGRERGYMISRRLILSALLSLALALPAFTQQVQYVCPMDRDVVSAKPGNCPKCGMTLRAAAPGDRPAPSGSGTRPAEGRVAKIQIPDTPVVDQDGRKLRFYTDLVKGKTVAINFIFTTCTTICPPLAANFRRVQQNLGQRIGREISLISVSVDPVVDIPARLKTFMNRYHAAPGWTFVTGRQSDVDDLLTALGAAVSDKNDHTPMVLIGNDPAGYWTRAYGLAAAPTLLKVINEAAAKPAAKTETP